MLLFWKVNCRYQYFFSDRFRTTNESTIKETNITNYYWHTMQDLYNIAAVSTIFEFLCTPTYLMTSLGVCAGVIIGAYVIYRRHMTSGGDTGSDNEAMVPESVNFHFTRQCNYKCGFCFHTAKTSYLLDIEDAKRGLKLLKDAGDEAVVCWV